MKAINLPSLKLRDVSRELVTNIAGRRCKVCWRCAQLDPLTIHYRNGSKAKRQGEVTRAEDASKPAGRYQIIELAEQSNSYGLYLAKGDSAGGMSLPTFEGKCFPCPDG